jgi:ABC-2 type transport system permease protein
MQTQPKRPSLLVQVGDLFLIQLSQWRWSWRRLIFANALTSLISIGGLGIFARNSGLESLVYVLIGNIVLMLIFGNQTRVANNFAYMRVMGTLSYFATLPIRRWVLILATIMSFLTLSLPSLVITALVGALLLGVELHVHPLIMLVVPVCTLAMSSIGALIGTYARVPEEASSVSQFIALAMICIGPVAIPPEQLPAFIVTLGWLSPATYVASAFRQTLIGPVTSRLVIDVIALAGLAVVIFWLAGRRIAWRQA